MLPLKPAAPAGQYFRAINQKDIPQSEARDRTAKTMDEYKNHDTPKSCELWFSGRVLNHDLQGVLRISWISGISIHTIKKDFNTWIWSSKEFRYIKKLSVFLHI